MAGGVYNAIGGDDLAYSSLVGAGGHNQVEASINSIIGAGAYNNLSASAPYAGASSDSGILAGQNNVVSGPNSAIAGGSYNQVVPSADATPNDSYGLGGFIGAGEKNTEGANYASIVGGSSNTIGSTSANSGDYGFIGGGYQNTVTGSYNAIAAGTGNSNAAGSSVIGAGQNNQILSGPTDAGILSGFGNMVGETASSIGGGSSNQISGNGNFSFIGGGAGNIASGEYSGIGGGYTGTVAASFSFVGGGYKNSVSGTDAFVGSGGSNNVGSSASYSSIVGGYENTASGAYASILGGFDNTANGTYATVAGGYKNTAKGELSFAAGYHADAVNNGSFVWSDYVAGSELLKDSAKNEFVVRAAGGVYVYSSDPAASGVELAPGESTWSSLSDRNAKTNIVPLDDDAILAKVGALPIDAWSYKSDKTVRHVGPMAQDFYAAFGTGVDDRHIASIDEDGVALAAIKALYEENTLLRVNTQERDAEKDAQIMSLSSRVRHLESAVAKLLRRR